MKKVYLDNAATTKMYPEVVQEMLRVLENEYGNPSSTHSFGRAAKNLIENSRKNIAKLINAQASEIIFTSSATEASNWILKSVVNDLKINRVITTRIEHHATLHTLQILEKEQKITLEYIPILENGLIDYQYLATLLHDSTPTLVSLLHVNNEIGTVLDLKRVSTLCSFSKALFHCDAVQSIGKQMIDVSELGIDFMVASAHKFHGPKGVGFAFIKKNSGLKPFIYGGSQEKGLRAGTEAVHQIVGLERALSISIANIKNDFSYINDLKTYCWEALLHVFPDAKINGAATFHTILNVQLPISEEKTALLLFHLDMKGIAVSRGSACQSGSIKPSHVLAEFLPENEIFKPSLRISFSSFNTKEDIDYLVEVLKAI